jgi:hypothetical protein
MRFIHGLFVSGIGAVAIVLSAPSAYAAPAYGNDLKYDVAYSCTIDSLTHVVTSIDWLRVHTSPGVSTPAVGQIPGGAAFHFCSSSGQNAGGRYWVYGYGYNGSVKLTGWVAGEYLIWP